MKYVKKKIKVYYYTAHRMILENGTPKSIGEYTISYSSKNAQDRVIQDLFNKEYGQGVYLVTSITEQEKIYGMPLDEFITKAEEL